MMGKNKIKKYKPCKPNPTGLPSVRDLVIKEEELGTFVAPVSDNIQAMIEKFQSGTSDEEFESACFSLANFANNQETVSYLMSQKIVKLVGPLLISPNPSVRLVSSGALRNLSVSGDHKLCEEMVQQDIMTPLIKLLKQYFSEWQPLSKNKEQDFKIDLYSDTFVQAVHLLWNLCESSSVAVDIFNLEGILPILVNCLNIDVYGLQTAITVAHCLYTLSEDNTNTFSMLENSSLQKMIHNLGSERMGHTLYKTLLAGILFNINKEVLEGISSVRSTIMDTLSGTLTINCISFLTSLVHQVKKNVLISSSEMETDKVCNSEVIPQNSKLKNIAGETEELTHLLTAQQLALELLANICCDDCSDTDWEELDISDASESEDRMDDDANQPVKIPFTLAPETHEAVVGSGLLKLAVDKLSYPEDGLLDTLSSSELTEQLVKKFQIMYSRALVCISNMLMSVDAEGSWTSENLYTLWVNLGQLAMKQNNAVLSEEFIESVTNAMRAVLEKFSEKKIHPQLVLVTENDLHNLFTIAKIGNGENIQINIIRIVSILGCLLGMEETTRHMITIIGQYLLETCKKENLWIVAEALDAIFDVFGEDYTDNKAVEIGLVDKLKPISQSFRQRVSQQRKQFHQHLPIIKTAQVNLQRFINYKIKALSITRQHNGKLYY